MKQFKVYAIDFDGILCSKNKPLKDNIKKVNELFEDPSNYIVINTARSWSCLEEVRHFLSKHKVKFHSICMEKTRASVYIDDRNGELCKK